MNKQFFFTKIIVLLLVLFVSCNPQGTKSGKTIITGTFTQFPGAKVILSEINIRSTAVLDTLTLNEDGEFRFRVPRDSAGLYLLKIDQRNYITLVVGQEKKIHVFSDQQRIRSNYTVEGSGNSQKLAEFESALENNRDKIDSLIMQYKKIQANINISSASVQMDEVYQKILNDQVSISRRFIEDNCGSLASLLVIDKRFGMKKILTEKNDGEYYLMLDSCLTTNYPGNKHVLEFNERMEIVKQQKAIQDHRSRLLAIGKKVPDITLEDPTGKSISLSSFMGNKVIIYFWASWDKSSRKANPELKRIYEMFAPGGLKVYAIGLESYNKPWKGAIKADKLTWTNVTDYLNIQSATVSLFNVPKDLPYFYLLDEEMKILYKGNDFVDLLSELKSDTE